MTITIEIRPLCIDDIQTPADGPHWTIRNARGPRVAIKVGDDGPWYLFDSNELVAAIQKVVSL